jgi:putative transposase
MVWRDLSHRKRYRPTGAFKTMRYRRALIPGGSYFFTVNLADRSSRLLVARIADLREVVRDVRRAHPFTIVAWVVLPDHLHAVWTLPEGDTDYATRWGLIKAGFSRRIPKDEHIRASRALKGERGIWQRRFWEHLIRDDLDLARHVDYIHYKPVKHGYVDRTMDWPYSTFHRDLRRGHVTEDWGVRDGAMGDFGEAACDRAGHVGVRASPQPAQAGL